jgi:hypothetical protein
MGRAAGAFGVAPENLTYKFIARGNPWAPGLRASEARVLVELPERPEPGGPDETAPSDGNGEQRPGLREERSVPGGEGGRSARGRGSLLRPGEGGAAPRRRRPRGQPARLPQRAPDRGGHQRVSLDPQSRGRGPAAGAAGAPAPGPAQAVPDRAPPRPPGGGRRRAPISHPAAIKCEDPSPHLEPLEHKIAELEEHVNSLQRELRLEKARQAQRLESELADVDGSSSYVSVRNTEDDDGRRRGNETFDETLLSP